MSGDEDIRHLLRDCRGSAAPADEEIGRRIGRALIGQNAGAWFWLACAHPRLDPQTLNRAPPGPDNAYFGVPPDDRTPGLPELCSTVGATEGGTATGGIGVVDGGATNGGGSGRGRGMPRVGGPRTPMPSWPRCAAAEELASSHIARPKANPRSAGPIAVKSFKVADSVPANAPEMKRPAILAASAITDRSRNSLSNSRSISSRSRHQ